MPYKDPEKQKAAQARYFQENKDRLLKVQNSKRNKMRRKIQEIKGSTPCADCGESFPHYIMQFDHLPQFRKLFTIGTTSNATSMTALLAEIAKCEVVCANCHAHRTFMRSRKESNLLTPEGRLGLATQPIAVLARLQKRSDEESNPRGC